MFYQATAGGLGREETRKSVRVGKPNRFRTEYKRRFSEERKTVLRNRQQNEVLFPFQEKGGCCRQTAGKEWTLQRETKS